MLNNLSSLGLIVGGSFISTWLHHVLVVKPNQLKGLPPSIAAAIQSADEVLIGKADQAVADVIAKNTK